MNTGKGLVRFVVISSLFVMMTGCANKGNTDENSRESKTISDNSAVPAGEVLAKVGDQVITKKEFETQLSHQNPLIRARFKSMEQKKKLLDNLVQREAMVLEAKRLGLDKDPEVIQGFKKILARQLVNSEFNKKRVKELKVTDEEIEKYYKENSNRYHAPEKVRVHQIFFSAPRTDSAKVKKARAMAKEILSKLKAKPGDRRMFLELARQYSDDEETKKVGGDTNFRTKAQLEDTYGKKFADAAFSLKKANDLSGIIQTEKGFYILRQSGRQGALDLPLEKVKGQIRTTLFARARGEAYKKFVEELKSKVGIKIFEDVLKQVKVDTTMPSSRGHNFPGSSRGGIKRPSIGKPSRLSSIKGIKPIKPVKPAKPGKPNQASPTPVKKK